MRAPDQLQGCKLPRHLENPIDDSLMVAIEPLLQPLRDAGVTPNMVTLASAAASAASLYFCFERRPLWAVGYWFLAYLFDVMDGFMARRFGMETALGDRLDHISDLLAYGGLLLFVCWRVRTDPRPLYWPLAVEAILTCLAMYHMQCQEKDSHFIPIRGLRGNACRDKEHLRYTRWVGVGTLTAWHLVFIWCYARRG